MKRVLIIAFVFAMGIGSQSFAQYVQDCDDVVRANYGYQEGVLEQIPPYKYHFHCAFSQEAFYFAEELPAEAIVYDIADLVDYTTRDKVADVQVPESTFLNYYRYSYGEIQVHHPGGSKIYFRLHQGPHAYLVLRSNGEILSRVNDRAQSEDFYRPIHK